jgi:hypothetical protein
VFGTRAAQFTVVGVMTNDPPHVYPLSQYIGVTNLSGFQYLTNGTISFWAQFDGGNSNNDMYLFDNGYNSIYALSPAQASNSWTILYHGFFYYPQFYVYPGQGGQSNVVRWPSFVLATTNFHLYTVTVDCPNNLAIAYADGNAYQSNTINLPWIRVYGHINQHWLCIGAMSHDGTPQWGDDKYPNAGFTSGKMDDIRIYNRTLSADEVHNLYHASGIIQEPIATIRQTSTQSMRICWDSLTNVFYQVEYKPNTSTDTWTELGSPVPGSGGTDCVTDSLLISSQRFYRVRPVP